MNIQKPYKSKNKIRIVTAASLFDGHDAAINIMRRIIQATGVEVIHLGHDRSVEEVVNTAIQEDVNSIAMTSYQGGHNEYFKYMYDLLQEKGAGHIRIFGGGGGVILPDEIDDLMRYGIKRIYSPDDGREMGLQGMINDLVGGSDYATGADLPDDVVEKIKSKDKKTIAQAISAAENFPDKHAQVLTELRSLSDNNNVPVLGITGTGPWFGLHQSSVASVGLGTRHDFPQPNAGFGGFWWLGSSARSQVVPPLATPSLLNGPSSASRSGAEGTPSSKSQLSSRLRAADRCLSVVFSTIG